MGGLISTGMDYEKTAVSGLIRQSALEAQLKEANKEYAAQQDIQKAKIGAEGAAVGATAGYAVGTSAAVAGTEAGATLGTWAGPVGALAGAALGFIFAKLF